MTSRAELPQTSCPWLRHPAGDVDPDLQVSGTKRYKQCVSALHIRYRRPGPSGWAGLGAKL
jgi:hypothetical protein